MTLKEKQSAIFWYLELIFKLCFLTLGFLNFNSVFFGGSFVSFFVDITVALGGLSLAYRIFHFKNYINNVVIWLLIGFLASYGITLVLFREYGTLVPIKTWVWLGMQILLLYATDLHKKTEDYKREMQIILSYFVIVTFISGCTSFVYLFTQYSNIREYEGIRVITGFIWGRLWGVYTDPNFAAIMSVISMLITLYVFMAYKSKALRAFSIFNIIVQTMYIAFSDSRSGKLAAVTGVLLFSFLNLLIKFSSFKSLLRTLLSLALAILFACGMLLTINTEKVVYNQAIVYFMQKSDSSINEDPPKTEGTQSSIGREQDIENDISNRRFALWGSALETFKTRPVFGVSFNHLVTYTKKYLPETYLVNNDHGVFENYHNSLFNILVGQGILGFTIFIAAAVIAGIKSIKKVSQTLYTDLGKSHILLFSILIVVLVSSMFLQEIVYTLSPNTFLFWLMLGYMTKNGKGEETVCLK